MRIELTEVLRLEEQEVLTLAQFVEMAGLSAAEVQELVGAGVLAPVRPGAAELAFQAQAVLVARTARRLRQDFGLDADALALVMTLLERIQGLEAQVRHLNARLPGSAQ